jgi:tape measure domain-containing protein
MASGANVGSAYITIKPSFEGGVRSINRQLEGMFDTAKVGGTLGGELSKAMMRAMPANAMAGLSKAAEVVAKQSGSAFESLGGRISGIFTEAGIKAGGNLGRGLIHAGVGFGNLVNEATGAASKVQGAFSASIGAIKREFSGIGSAAKAALGVAAGGLGIAAKEGMGAYDSIKKFSGTMRFAGFDDSAVKSYSQEMQDYAKQTVYNLSDVMTTTAQLGANGVKDFDRLTQALGNVNAAQGGTAQSFGLAAQQLVQMNANGKVLYADWKVFAEDMPGASKMIQEQLAKNGAYTGEFTKAMSDGQITADEFNQALMDIGFTDAAVAATGSITTFESAFGEVADTIALDVADVIGAFTGTDDLTAFTNSITGAIDEAAGFVKEHAPEIRQGFETIVDVAKKVALPLLAAYGAFKLIKTAVAIHTTLSAFAEGLSAIGGSAAEMVEKTMPAPKPLGDTGKAAALSAKQMLSASAAMLAFGAMVVLVAAGFWVMTQAATQLAAAGPLAIATMAGMLVAVGALAAVFANVGPQLTAGSVGMLAFGGAVVLAAAGMLLMATAASMLASGGAGAALALGLMVVSVGALAVLFAAIGPALTLASVGMLSFGAAVLMAGAGLLMMGAAVMLASSGIAMMAVSLPVIAAYGMQAAMAVTMLGASLMVMGTGALLAAPGLVAIGLAVTGAAAGMVAFSAAAVPAAGAMAAMAGGAASAASGVTAISGTAASAASSLSSLGSTAGSAFGAVASAAESAMARAEQTVSSSVRSIISTLSEVERTFTARVEVEVGALPHFSMSGSFNAQTGSVPSVSVSWWKSGAFFRPGDLTFFGAGDAHENEYMLTSSHLDAIADRMDARGGGGVTNVYEVNGLSFNDDTAVAKATRDYLLELKRLAVM